MLAYISRKWQKTTALFLYMVFYLQFIGYSMNHSNGNYIPYREALNKKRERNSVKNVAGNRITNKLVNTEGFDVRSNVPSTYINSRREIVERHVANKFYGPLTGGPGQPEMNTFRSVGADNMVNLFTGDFSYNIPLLDVGGYPINIFYNAGITMDQEATWVGLGWNLNPGTINRNMRGLPDDFDGSAANGDLITKEQSIKQDLTVGGEIGANVEVVGSPFKIGGKLGAFWNNRRGIGVEIGGDFSVESSIAKKSGTEKTSNDSGSNANIKAGLGFNLNSQSGLSLRANAGFETQAQNLATSLLNGVSTSVGWSSRQGLTEINIEAESKLYKKLLQNRWASAFLPGKLGTSIEFARPSYTPSIRMPMTKYNGSLQVKGGFEGIVVYTNAFLKGYVSKSYIAEDDKKQQRPAFGYMNYEKAEGNDNALLDFNRLNDGTYTLKTPVISIPNYTYDVFSINGEGTGGSFRGYRGSIGFVRDNKTESREGSLNLSFDLGGGQLFHAGLEANGIYSKTIVGDWEKNNILRNNIAFDKSDGNYQGFYFKNPGEKAIIDENYYSAVGSDQLIRPTLSGSTALPVLTSNFEVFDSTKKNSSIEKIMPLGAARKERDKRTQIITYLTAEEAEKVGLDKKIYSYPENEFLLDYKCKRSLAQIRRFSDPCNEDECVAYRKRHHLSEIDVLEGDGKRYVYGLPAYTIKQKEASFSISGKHADIQSQIVDYTSTDASVLNSKGRDNFFQAETMPAYAHSFLLTAILSPDYVDVRDDGITDDDIGTAIKFNYTRVNKTAASNSWETLKWRTPAGFLKAHYNEGLKTDNADDKALYTYGEKELWYAHSIESKNMVATFNLSSVRNDGYAISDETGGVNGSVRLLRKLERIDLFTKAELLRANQENRTAKPVKSVHFKYSYSLCKNAPSNPNNIEGGGKLTLDSLWFSYNGNYKYAANKYRFKYASLQDPLDATKDLGNPSFGYSKADRWGNYKDEVKNPALLTNADFPYTLQGNGNKTINDLNASAWSLAKVQIPSGAVINVEYEGDDYAFVQNRRAAQMTRVAGFAVSKTASPSNALYNYNGGLFDNPGEMDNRFVFFDTEEAITEYDIRAKYLAGMNQLLLKIWVEMPSNNYGYGYEPITVYATVKDAGIVSGNNHRFWVELDKGETGGSPIMETVMQFLKDYLPSKAYKGYDNGDEPGLEQFVAAIQALGTNFIQAVKGFEKDLKGAGKCKLVDLNKSFVRLNNPILKKMGGGHRVKRIVISDNWRKMIKPSAPISTQLDSYYGQEYSYTTTDTIKNTTREISSGVASYEPGIGNEENPFREILKYSDKQPLGPTNINNVELPVAETFFPSPSVGYSRVAVRSIHNKSNKAIKSNTGLSVTEFYTTKDFPAVSDYTDFDAKSRVHFKPSPIMKFMFKSQMDYLTLSQGFRVMLNDMNGKIKSQASYPENDFVNPVNYTKYIYRQKNITSNTYRPENNLLVANGPNEKVSNKIVGREVEVMNDFREHFSYTYTAKIPTNVEGFLAVIAPILIPSIFDLAFRDQSIYRSATTLKIVTDYGILDSIINIDKGSVVTTKNMLYDGETGEVLVSQTNNAFDKPVYNFTYPAHWVNSGMGLAYKNIDIIYTGVRFEKGEIKSSHVDMGNFESGDEIYVVDKAPSIPMRNSANCVSLGDPALLPPSDQSRIWAIDIAKDNRNDPDIHRFVFIDRYGTPYNAAKATIRVIRSGKRNMGSVAVGSISSLASPIVTESGEMKIKITAANTKVLNASAAEFKEKWRAEDGFYVADTSVFIKQYVKVRDTIVYPQAGHNISEYKWAQGFCLSCPEYQGRHFYNTDHFIAEQFSFGGGSHSKHKYKSWLRYNLNSIPQSSKIKSANLNLFSHSLQAGPLVIATHLYKFHNTHHDPDDWTSDGGHENASPLYSGGEDGPLPYWNNFRVNRMLGLWGDADNNPDGYELPGYYNQVEVSAPGYSPATKNYTELPNSANDALDVKGIVEGMLRDRGRYDPAIKLSLINPNHNVFHNSGVCFFGNAESFDACQRPGGALRKSSTPTSSVTPGGCASIQNNYKPFIHIKYTYCPEALPPGVPPPAGEEYDSCFTRQDGKMCLSVFSRNTMNPYIHGILGNWRPWRSYVFYGYRKEKNTATVTNIGTDGSIAEFENFWVTGSSTGYLQKSNSTKWVWNSETTQFNRKGAEIENHDPLGRYNSGLYGYGQTLPVATTNNARVRETAFEGFEDQYYIDEPCTPECYPARKHFKTGAINSYIDPEEHHTGSYSFKLPAGNTSYSFASFILPNEEESTPDVRIKNDGVLFTQTAFTPRGKGLTRRKYDLQSGGISDGLAPIEGPIHNVEPSLGEFLYSFFENPSNSYKWSGVIQPDVTGDYKFNLLNVDDEGDVYINNQKIYSGRWEGITDYQAQVHLERGHIYPIKIIFNNKGAWGRLMLMWKMVGSQNGPGGTDQFEPVNKKYLYAENDTPPLHIENNYYCYKPEIIQSINHSLIDSFCLLPGKRYLFSAWVKEGAGACDGQEYVKNAIQVLVNGAALPISPVNTAIDHKPSGPVIEGWQRYEFDFTIPVLPGEGSTAFEIKLKNTNASKAAYFDDLRISPYNSNMKSFVYDPVSLRLVAELDENNYAAFYEYDNEGTLSRVKKETVKGIKTIQETRSGLQKKLLDF